MCENSSEDAKGFYTKVSALRAEVHTKDWADDKMLSIGGRGGYGYLSNDKIVKQIAPLFPKHGLEVELDYSELTEHKACGSMEQHWTVKLSVTLVDIDTGYKGVPSVVYGEAADVGDKGINKALTCAYKNWHLKFFGIADGMDPDAETVESVAARRFMKTAEEKEEVKSKVLETAKAAQSTQAPKAEPRQDQKPEPKAEPKPAPKAEPKAETKKSGDDTTAGKATPKSGFTPKTPHRTAINKIMADWETMAKAGKVKPEEYNEMSSAYLDMNSDQDAIAFIKKYKRALV